MPDAATRARARKGKRTPDIDFEKALLKGRTAYDTAVGDWWESRASNGSHRRAYAEIADWMAAQMARPAGKTPRLIVDYACGGGHFLPALARRFPRARIVALDGSRAMLERARARLAAAGLESALVAASRCCDAAGPRIRLVETKLPNFSLPKGRADAVAYLFPNLTSSPSDQDYYDRHGYRNRRDAGAATVLSRLREKDPEDEVTKAPPAEIYDGLMTERVVGRHIRSLLKKGGLWFKADYANARREELSKLTQLRTLFAEGALEDAVDGRVPERFFRFLDHRFARSQVILDVYHQTQDPTDRTGGYFVSGFRAL